MTIIEAQVKDQELKVTTEPLVASGGINETTIHFSFCENWTNFVKTAVFADAGKENWYNVVLDANKAVVPAQVTATKGRFWFGVVGIKDQTRYTTKIIQYDVAEGVTLAEEDVEPPQTLIDQLMAALGNVSAEASAVRTEMQIHPTGAPVKDDTVAYIKNVPAASLPAAKINKIGGMTRKCANLLPENTAVDHHYWEANGEGFLYKVNYPNEAICFERFKVEPNTTYCVSSSHSMSWAVWFADENSQSLGRTDGWKSTNTTFETPSTPCYALFCSLYSGGVYQNDIMLNAGDTALPYEPYFEGLRSAPVTEIESVGVNLFDNGLLTNSQNWQYLTIKAEPNTTYTAYSNAPYIASVGVYMFNSTDAADTPNQLFKDKVVTLTTNSDGIIKVQYRSSSDLNISDYYYQLNKGSTALPYAPYVKHTLPIPEAVKALDGYGDGINADCYNYIDYEKKQFVQRVGVVDMGTLNWVFTDTYSLVTINDMDLTPQWLSSAVPSKVKQMAYDGANPIFYLFYDSGAYASINDLIADVQGIKLCYELAEPIITDISDILPADNFIGVEGGGTMTFKNEFGYAVPSEVINYLNAATGVIVDGNPALKVGDTIITEAQLTALLGLI